MLKFTQTLRPKRLKHTQTHTHTHKQTNTHKHTNAHTHTQNYTHIHTITHNRAHTYTNLHIYEYNIVPSSKGMAIHFIHEGCSYVAA